MGRDPLIALVGKPSSGKSTMLNSLTDASAKTGAFPFTTIDPNKAIGYLQIECACKRYGMESCCKPVYGYCENGNRYVPIQLLDVAGLVPGAHEGKGLGNKFLDDLRHADCLIHVVDVSGTTDANGKQTRGYDPLKDIDWLTSEIIEWVYGNLNVKWSSIVRRHKATMNNDQSLFKGIVHTLQLQLSGYGAIESVVAKVIDKSGLGNKPLEEWTKENVKHVATIFVDVKFPTVLALNKIDHPDADKNISKITRKYNASRIVLTSAISEVFIKRLKSQHYVKYEEGTEFLYTKEDLPNDNELKQPDEKLLSRIENLRDLVLYRFGSTGILQVLKSAAKIINLIPVYPVLNTHNLSSLNKSNLFKNCFLITCGSTTVGQFAHRIMGGNAQIAYIEGPNGVRIKDSDLILSCKNDILSFKIGHI